jgi:hypothetical protein
VQFSRTAEVRTRIDHHLLRLSVDEDFSRGAGDAFLQASAADRSAEGKVFRDQHPRSRLSIARAFPRDQGGERKPPAAVTAGEVEEEWPVAHIEEK